MLQTNFDINTFSNDTIALGDPAVATNWTYTVPIRLRVLLVSAKFTFSTDANVADRTIRINIQEGAHRLITTFVSQGIAANLIRNFNFFIGAPTSIAVAAGEDYIAPLPQKLYLGPGSIISSDIRAIQAADQLSTVIMRFHRWIQH